MPFQAPLPFEWDTTFGTYVLVGRLVVNLHVLLQILSLCETLPTDFTLCRCHSMDAPLVLL